MIDLEHLDALDDDAPPEPDLPWVQRRAARIRRHNGVAAAGIGVMVIALALGAVAAYPRGSTARPAIVTPPLRTTSSGTLPSGLHAELTLDTPTVALGNDIRATLVVRNDTGGTVKLIDDGILACDVNLEPELRDANRRVLVAANPGNFFCRGNSDPLEPRASRTYPVTVWTRDLEITSQKDVRLTLSDGAGWSLPSLPVTITVPSLGIRLEPHETLARAGDVIEGTVLFTNRSGKPIDYELVGCPRRVERPWSVLLSKDGHRFYIGQFLVGCTTKERTVEHLGPGESRVPFSVALKYTECSSTSSSPDSPACGESGWPGVPQMPDLEPGEYQVVFEGRRGSRFEAIEVDPVTVRVG